jgi:sugar phosphate isomerase/epimerase
LAAPTIIGSMQGRAPEGSERAGALGRLAEALNELGEYARQYRVPLIYEPLNRYETDLVNTIDDAARLLDALSTDNVRLLADLFHMNIEETDVAAAIRGAAQWIGHVHLADSNRRPAGNGHIDYGPIAAALHDIDFQGYASAEALPWPDTETAARQTLSVFHRYFCQGDQRT